MKNKQLHNDESFMSRINGTFIFYLLKKSKHLLLIFRSLSKVLLFISLRNPLTLDMARSDKWYLQTGVNSITRDKCLFEDIKG